MNEEELQDNLLYAKNTLLRYISLSEDSTSQCMKDLYYSIALVGQLTFELLAEFITAHKSYIVNNSKRDRDFINTSLNIVENNLKQLQNVHANDIKMNNLLTTSLEIDYLSIKNIESHQNVIAKFDSLDSKTYEFVLLLFTLAFNEGDYTNWAKASKELASIILDFIPIISKMKSMTDKAKSLAKFINNLDNEKQKFEINHNADNALSLLEFQKYKLETTCTFLIYVNELYKNLSNESIPL